MEVEMGNIYRRAIEIIKQRGRGNTRLINRDGKVCLVGALALAKGMTPYELENALGDEGYDFVASEIRPVSAVIEDQFGVTTEDKLTTAYTFNDDDKTTDDDVILVLEKAAIQWDELNG